MMMNVFPVRRLHPNRSSSFVLSLFALLAMAGAAMASELNVSSGSTSPALLREHHTTLLPNDTAKPGRTPRKTVERFAIWVFPFDDARFDSHMQRLMDEYVIGSVRTGSEIVVTGHTDSVGMERHNLGLSERRGRNAAEYMKGRLKGVRYHSLSHRGVGEERPLYGSGLPEERFFNRTVEVIISSPR